MRRENSRLSARVDSLEQQLAITMQEATRDSVRAATGTSLSEDDLAYLKGQGLPDPVVSLKADLVRNAGLIPQEGVLGGTMRFSEDRIQVLNRRWVLAYFEDGHNAGNALLAYNVKNGKITWKVILSEPL